MRTLLPISVLVLALCALVWGAAAHRRTGRVEGPWTRPLAERLAEPFPRTIPTGRDVLVMEAPPHRILAGSVLATEVLLEICPPDRIAAVHALAADPRFSAVAEAARAFPRRAGATPEAMLSFRPDLVITDAYTRAETQYLMERTGALVARTQPFSSIAQVQDNIRMVGWMTGLDAGAEDLVADMERRLAAVAEGRDGRGDWGLLYLDGALYTFGSDSTLDDLLRRIGARNVAAERGVGPYDRLSVEEALCLQPEALLVGALPGEEEAERRRIRQDPGLKTLECVQRDRIVFVPGALLASTSHHLAEAAERIAATLDRWGHP